MNEIIIRVKKKEKLPFLKELLGHIDFVEIVEEKSKAEKKDEVLKDLDEAVAFVKSYKKGKTKVKSINQLLDEV